MQYDEVLLAIERLGLFQSARHIPDATSGGASVLEGEVTIDGHEVTVRIVLDASFPNRLPRFFLEPWDALGFIPHVSRNGQICFLDPEGLVIDRRRPVAVVEDAYERAMQTLLDGVTGINRADFANEWEVYWGQLTGIEIALSAIDPAIDDVRQVLFFSRTDALTWVAHDSSEIAAFYNGTDMTVRLNRQYGLYLPLEVDALPIPPRADRPFWTLEDTRRLLLDNLSAANRVQVQRLTKRPTRTREYVIVRLPRPAGGATLFGIRFDDVHGPHPLRVGGRASSLVPLIFQQVDRGYLVERGGSNIGLGMKRVLLLGCGAVGGHLSVELARAGVLNLTIVDDDTLTLENSFRHVLGRKYWGKPKAQALKDEIEALLPFVRVTPVVASIEAALAAGTVDLADYDLVVLALGNPTVELEINARLHGTSTGPAVLVTWVEPLGIGGHALLAGNSHGGGCFECLYTSPSGDDGIVENRAAFAEPGQIFGRALSGCGSLYTPYASMDALQTAILAARLAVDALTGSELGNPLLSWKGDAGAFTAAGFRVSPRFDATHDQLYGQRYSYHNSHCHNCGACVQSDIRER